MSDLPEQKIQRDSNRCWVRIDHLDNAGGIRYQRTLIGDAWALEPFGDPRDVDNEFSLTVTVNSGEPDDRPIHAGLRLGVPAGRALYAALGEWLNHPITTKGTE